MMSFCADAILAFCRYYAAFGVLAPCYCHYLMMFHAAAISMTPPYAAAMLRERYFHTYYIVRRRRLSCAPRTLSTDYHMLMLPYFRQFRYHSRRYMLLHTLPRRHITILRARFHDASYDAAEGLLCFADIDDMLPLILRCCHDDYYFATLLPLPDAD